MAIRNPGSTVLHEHRGIITVRHLLALVNFIAILASTVITRYFVLVRGASNELVLTINALTIINILQIVICFSDYFTKVLLGKYPKIITRLAYFVGIVWVLAVLLEFGIGSKELGEVRIDLGVIASLQILTALIAYFVWPRIDYVTLRKMTHKSTRDDIEKRIKKARGGIAKYIVVCVMMVVIQLGMLYAYELPPKVYDLFSESRQLKYQLSADKNSYEVVGIYRGTSSYVNVPAYYNNKPVTALKSGALSSIDFMDSNKVERIDFGTLVVNEDGSSYYESYIQTLESGAIKNHTLLSLTLPASITRIENGAIISSSLRSLLYEAKADFAYSYLNCESLSTITFNGDEAGKIVSLDGMSSDVTLEVSKHSYNSYREKNPMYIEAIRPILASDEFVIDFYTNTDYYIESIFCKIGESVRLSYQDLKNDQITDMISPATDTLAYINDRHEKGTNGSKADSAFRGWYFDKFFTDECRFSADSEIVLTGNTSIYAKWIDEYTGTLDWGTYRPAGQPKTLYWTEEDPVTFPVIEDRAGYAEGILWSYGGKTVKTSEDITESTTISGKWMLDLPVIDILPYAQSVSDPNFVISTDKNAVSFIYDEYQKLHMEAEMQHPLNDVTYSTKWTKVGDPSFANANQKIEVQNVLESGEYILEVTAKSPYADESTSETRVVVTIAKKELDIGTAKLHTATSEYSGQSQRIVYTGDFVHDKIDTVYTYYDETGAVVTRDDGVKDVGRYRVVATFQKNNAQEAANYGTKELIAEFTITPKELTFVKWSASEFTYNTAEQAVLMEVSGIRANDQVEILYEDNRATNAGEYVAKAIGVSNPNYSIKNIDASNDSIHAWRISPKTITVKEWRLDDSTTTTFKITYNGKMHVLEAVADGVYSTDMAAFSFIYENTANTVSATNANKYTAKIVGVSNPNYQLLCESTQEWEIEKRPITVVYDAATGYIYNGSAQTVNATLSGILAEDLQFFERDKFVYEGKSEELAVSDPMISGTNLVISFSAKNANEYTAQISGIDSAADVNLNYQLVSAAKTFRIQPKTLTVVPEEPHVYSGKNQALGVQIVGIVPSDLANVKYDQFTSTTLKSGMVSGDTYLLTLTGLNAGDYTYDVTAFTNPNYRLTAVNDGKLTISKKPLTVNWKIQNLSATTTEDLSSGASFVYNAVGYNVIAEIVGVQNNENVTLKYVNREGLNVGSYVTEVSLPSEFVNYDFKTESTSWKITPYTVDFTWLFNDVEHNVNAGVIPTFTYSAQAVEVRPVYKLLGTDTTSISYHASGQDLVKTNASTDTYKVSISSLSNPNYQVGTGGNFSWKIEPKTVTVTWGNQPATITYNGEYHGPQFSLNGLLEVGLYVGVVTGNADSYLEITSTDTSALYDFRTTKQLINANSYTCDVPGVYTKISDTLYTQNTNYEISCTALSYTIKRAPLTLVGWSYETKGNVAAYTDSTHLVYNGSTYTLTNAIKEPLFAREGVTDSVSLLYSNNVQRNYSASGFTLTVSLTGAHSGNYELKDSAPLTWRIEQKEIALSWTDLSFVYNGSYHGPTIEYQSDAATADDKKVYAGDILTFTVDCGSQKKAGNYTATVISLGNTNYKIASGNSQSWSIAQKEIPFEDLIWSTAEFIYNAAPQYPTASYYDSTLGTTIDVLNYEKAAGSKDVQGGAPYTIKALTLADANYTLVGTNVGHEYVIKQKVINFDWKLDTISKTAGNFVYDGSTQLLYAHPDSYQDDDVIITYDLSEADRYIHDAGTYTVRVVDISNPNYRLDLELSRNLSKTVTITPKTVSLAFGFEGSTSNIASFTYDGKPRTVAASITNLCGNDSVMLTYSPETVLAVLDAGSYTFTVTALDNPNYALPAASSCTKSITVSPQKLTLTWEGATTATFDGKSHALTANLSGTINGTTVQVAPVYDGANSFVNAGTYTIRVSSMGSASSQSFNANNFELPTNCSKSIVIAKQTLSINWSGSTTVTYDGMPHALTATLSGTIDDATVTADAIYTNSINAKTNAGTYTFTVSGIGASANDLMNSSNFELPSMNSQTLTIQKYTVKVVWSGKTNVEYDGEAHLISATVTGVDGLAVPFKYYNSSTGTTSATPATAGMTNAGNTTISISLDSTTNYQLPTDGSDKKVLTIAPQPVNITWTGASSVIYDGLSHKLTASVVGANDGKAVSFTASSTTTITSVGSRTYSISSLGNSNYTLTGATGDLSKTLTILPQPVRISWSGATDVIYDGLSHKLTASVVGANDGKTVSFTASSTTAITNVGSKVYSVDALSNSNYTLTDAIGDLSKTLTISPQSVIITWEGTGEHVYTGEYFTLTPTIRGLNDGVAVAFSGSGTTSFKNVGEYSFKIDSLASINYTLVGCTGETVESASVIPAEITISWSGEEVVNYDGMQHSLSATVTDAFGRAVNFTFMDGISSVTEVGTYILTLVIDELGTNYTLAAGSSLTATITVLEQVQDDTPPIL